VGVKQKGVKGKEARGTNRVGRSLAPFGFCRGQCLTREVKKRPSQLEFSGHVDPSKGGEKEVGGGWVEKGFMAKKTTKLLILKRKPKGKGSFKTD